MANVSVAALIRGHATKGGKHEAERNDEAGRRLREKIIPPWGRSHAGASRLESHDPSSERTQRYVGSHHRRWESSRKTLDKVKEEGHDRAWSEDTVTRTHLAGIESEHHQCEGEREDVPGTVGLASVHMDTQCVVSMPTRRKGDPGKWHLQGHGFR